MRYEEIVEVISITPAYDINTGRTLYQVIFGVTYSNPMFIPGQNVSPENASNRLAIFIPKEEECQYKVGSKWNLSVSETGFIKVIKAKKEEKNVPVEHSDES